MGGRLLTDLSGQIRILEKSSRGSGYRSRLRIDQKSVDPILYGLSDASFRYGDDW